MIGLGGMPQQELSRHHSSVGAAIVTIRVTWVYHPEDDAMFGRPQPSWLFTVNRARLSLLLSKCISDS
jgi:hypothetical protein